MNKKIRVALVFWVYCAILITFNEFIGLFVSKAFMRVGYIFLMVLFFGTTLDRYNFKVKLSKTDWIVLTYIAYTFFRGLLQLVSGNAIIGTVMTWGQNWIPVCSYFIARDLKDTERKTIESLFVLLSAISVTMGFLNTKINFLPKEGAFAGGLYADTGNGSLQLRGYSMAGIALITGFICGYSLCLLLNLKIEKKQKIALIVVNLFGCLNSLSRGAVAFVVIAAGIYLLILMPRKKKYILKRKVIDIVMISLIGIAFIAMKIDEITSSKFFGRFFTAGISRTEGSNFYRTEFQHNAFNMFMQSPVFGKGYGFTGYQAISAGVEGTINTESYILSLSISAGIIGLVLFAAVAIKSLIKYDKRFLKYACTVTGMLTWSCMYILLDSDLIGLFYWYCIGALGERKNPNEKNTVLHACGMELD